MAYRVELVSGYEVTLTAAIDEHLRVLAQQVADTASRLAPVLTGALRDSISVTECANGKATITAATDYAGYVELGTSRMAAQPYLKPALYQARG